MSLLRQTTLANKVIKRFIKEKEGEYGTSRIN
jgi:hypothetical protein